MRLVLTADPYLPVPPLGYGGIERVVALLAEELRRRGHRITLLAHPASAVAVDELVPYGVPPHLGRRARARELLQVGSWLWKRRAEVDLVHSFGRLAALLPILPLRRLPKVQTYQRAGVPWRSVSLASRLGQGSVVFTACSRSVYREPRGGRWETVFNCVDVRRYTLRSSVPPDAPLVFLGRIEAIKGVHHAIAIARLARRRLVIAGNRVEHGSARGYFQREVAPHLDDESVTWVGEVDDRRKDKLLGSAAALLMPIEWDEPFGIVMIEAMACGTPVIGFSRGSVPEIVAPGVNGFMVGGVDEAVEAVSRLSRLERAAVRGDCERRFGVHAIADRYEELYRRLAGGG